MMFPFTYWQNSAIPAPPIPTTGLVLYYNFEGENSWYEGSGSSVKNFGSGSNGTLSGGVGWNSDAGGNMQFRSANSRYINTGFTANNFGLFYGSASFCFTVRVPNFSVSPNYIFHPTNAPSYGSDVNIAVLGNQSFQYSHNTANPPNTLANYGAISANTWYHVVMSYEYANYKVRIYINGVEVVSNGFQERMVSADDGYWIGRNTGQYYDFDLGNFMIYNRVITAQEVTDIYLNQARFGI